MDGSNATWPADGEPVNASAGRNASMARLPSPPPIPAVHWVIMSLSPLGFVENGVLLWFLCFRMRKNPFTVYITHLSIADISLLFCIFILSIDYALDHELSSGHHYTMLTLSVTFLFGYNTGLYLLTAISVERCLSVLYPIWYRCHRPRHQSAWVCALLWALSCLVTSMEYVMCIDDDDDRSRSRRDCRAVIVFIAILTFVVFTPLMLVCSALLVVKIRKSSCTARSSKLYVVITVTIVIFLAFAMPMRLLYLLYYEYWAAFRGLHNLSLLFSTISSSANPFIYFFVGSSKKKRFKESLKVVLNRAFKDELQPQRPEESGHAVSVETVV